MSLFGNEGTDVFFEDTQKGQVNPNDMPE